jgi:hypothetical protein
MNIKQLNDIGPALYFAILRAVTLNEGLYNRKKKRKATNHCGNKFVLR